MKTVTARKLFVILTTSTAVCLPAPCQAATAVLPWDRTLTATQDMLIGTVAPAVIGLAFSSAGILYTLGRLRQRSRAPIRIGGRRLHRARYRSPAELRPVLTQFQS
jgi:hypothetical protein